MKMPRSRSFVAAIAALFAVVVAASAATLSSRYASLATAVQAKLDALPTSKLTKDQKRQKAAYTACLKFLAKDSTTLHADLGLAAKALVPLHATKLFADTSIATPASAMASSLGDAVSARRDALATSAAALPA